MNKYSDGFKEKCKALFPTWEKFHELLNNDQYFVGRYLDDSSPTSISNKDILEAKTLEELQKKASEQNEKVELYHEWCEEVKKWM